MSTTERYDVIIVGAGPADLSAAGHARQRLVRIAQEALCPGHIAETIHAGVLGRQVGTVHPGVVKANALLKVLACRLACKYPRFFFLTDCRNSHRIGFVRGDLIKHTQVADP